MSLDTLVNVTISVEATAPSKPNFGLPLLLAYHTHWPGLTKLYTSLEELTDDGFDENEEAYRMAVKLLSQKPHPPEFKIGRRQDVFTQIITLSPLNTTEGFVYLFEVDGEEVTYTVQSGDTTQDVVEALEALIEAIPTTAEPVVSLSEAPFNLDDGMTLNVTVDGVSEVVTFATGDFVDINAATAAEVVAAMNADLTGSPATAVGNAVQVASSTTGETSKVQVTGGTANAVLDFPTELSQGASFIDSTSENDVDITITANAGRIVPIDMLDMRIEDLTYEDVTVNPGIEDDLNAIVDADPDWYGLAIDSNSPAEVEAAVAWLETQRRIGVFSTANSEAFDPEADDDLLSTLKAAAYTRSTVIASKHKNNDHRATAWLSEELVKTPGSSTWAFKTLTGIEVDRLTSAEFAAVQAKYGSTYTSVGGVNITFEGKTPANEYMDIPHFIDKLHSDIQLAVFALLTTNDKLPYTDYSVELVKNTILAVLIRATKRPIEGLRANPAPTVTAPLVADIDIADRAARRLPDVEFSAELSGAIHKLVIRGKVTV